MSLLLKMASQKKINNSVGASELMSGYIRMCCLNDYLVAEQYISVCFIIHTTTLNLCLIEILFYMLS